MQRDIHSRNKIIILIEFFLGPFKDKVVFLLTEKLKIISINFLNDFWDHLSLLFAKFCPQMVLLLVYEHLESGIKALDFLVFLAEFPSIDTR